MDFALQKTLELLLIIGLGVLLQKKLAKQDLNGIKTLILSVALPATIFVALLKIELKGTLLVFPLIALSFNLVMLFTSKYFLSTTLPTKVNAKKRTLLMLMPSSAPGLSCFPFIVAYLGEDTLALAALADVGNKIFVLILLYLLAMHWYRKRALVDKNTSSKSKLVGLLRSLVNEPINMIMALGLLLLGFGLNFSSLPTFLQGTVVSIKSLMTPLVLLFIGLAVRINKGEFKLIASMLLRRAGLAFLLSGSIAYMIPGLATSMILLLVVFPQSACSFWPFAHMSAINAMENKEGQPRPTFDIAFAVNVLACSLPFSTALILGVFSFSELFVLPANIIGIGLGILVVSYIPFLFKKISSYFNKKASLVDQGHEISNGKTQKLEPRTEAQAQAS